MRLEPIILNALTINPEYSDKVRPHLTPEYFHDDSEKLVYELMEGFFIKYGKVPPRDSILIELDALDGIKEGVYNRAKEVVKETYSDEYEYDPTWLLDQTESFCKEKAVFNAIMRSVKIINGEVESETAGNIPSIMTKALAVAFDTSVGHDYFNSSDLRWDFYNQSEVRYKTRLEILNKITAGGPPSKALACVMGSSGSGKSAFMCALAADYIKDGYDVLYVTLELAEERVGERIDANLLNIPISEVKKMDRDRYRSKIESMKTSGYGTLVIKEYPTGSASVTHLELLLEELKTKKNFRPKIIFVDYIQIMASSRFKVSSSMNTYSMQKYIAEELRGFMMKHDLLGWTAVQTNRSGFNVSDMDESNIADSAGIIHVLDFLGAIIRDEQMKEEGKAIFKQIKNRWGSTGYFTKFAIGFDTERMSIYNIENSDAGSSSYAKPDPVDYQSDLPGKKKLSTDGWEWGE